MYFNETLQDTFKDSQRKIIRPEKQRVHCNLIPLLKTYISPHKYTVNMP